MRVKVPALTAAKEARILEAARRRFALYGEEKVTMEEIAADVGMGKASLYYYFPTKDDIFRRVVEHEQEQFLGTVRTQLRSERTAAHQLLRYNELRLRLFSELLTLNLAYTQPWHHVKPAIQDLYQVFSERELRMLTGIIAEGKKRGEFSADSPRRVATLLLHALQGLRLRYVRYYQLNDAQSEGYHDLQQQSALLVELIVMALSRKNSTLPVERITSP